MKVRLACIERDSGIQCRASIDLAVVNEYAYAMADGAEFPPVVLFGTEDLCWIGDGWHRIMAASQNSAEEIEAVLHEGGRSEAVRHALGANIAHGTRRTNADKRRCVEIALREFPKMSSRAIAELCGVSDMMVADVRPDQVQDSCSSTRTGLDGKQRPARRKNRKEERPVEEQTEPKPENGQQREIEEPKKAKSPKLGPPANAIGFVDNAILSLEQIKHNDIERKEAFLKLRRWIDEHE